MYRSQVLLLPKEGLVAMEIRMWEAPTAQKELVIISIGLVCFVLADHSAEEPREDLTSKRKVGTHQQPKLGGR